MLPSTSKFQEGFDVTHDSWILRKHVTLEAITAYEQILTGMAAASGTTADKVKLATFIGKQGQFSALAERARLQAHNIQRAQRAVKYLNVLSPLDIHFLCYYFKMCILVILSLFCTGSTNTSSAQMLTGSEFILFRVVVEALEYFLFTLVLIYTCLNTFLSRTTRTWEGVMQGLCM